MISVWFLLLVLVTNGDVSIKTIKMYSTQVECEAERVDVFKKNFKQAYPTEQNWGFKCMLAEKVETPKLLLNDKEL